MHIGRTASVTFLALLLISGCKKDAATQEDTPTGESKQANSQPIPPPDPSTLGTVTGIVKISGNIPPRVKIDMSQDPACSLAGQNLSEQIIATNGKLANVFVYIKNAPRVPVPKEKRSPVVLDQNGCRFTPHVVAIMQGSSVSFTNSDPTMHNVHTMPLQVGNRGTDISQGPGGKPEEMKFNTSETMIPVRCNNHPWMNSFINVSPTPLFAISGTSGEFQIPAVPAGSYTLVFVHEKLGTMEVPIVVQAHHSTEASVSFTAK